MPQDRPTSTTSMDATVASWSGQDNPVEKKNSQLNPAAHGFNKAKHNPVTPPNLASDGHFKKGGM